MSFYFKLHNGCHDPEDAGFAGFAGAVIGPLTQVHFESTRQVMLTFVNEADALCFGIDPKLPVIRFRGSWAHEDMLCHQMPGETLAYYCDWTICSVASA